jgi:hypothetical protein
MDQCPRVCPERLGAQWGHFSTVDKNAPRRRDPDATQETWLIHYDDIRFGNVVMRQRLIELESSLHAVSHRGCKRLGIA